jgi:hypothetical protein
MKKQNTRGKKRMRRYAWLGLILVGWCMGEQGTRADSPGDVAFFEAKIRPLLHEHCFSCHSGQPKKQKGGLSLESRASLLKGGDSGPAILPTEPGKSLLIKAVHYQDATLQMPPKGKLPERELALLEEWVRRGAPYPGTSEKTENKTTINLAEGRKFWSFQPVRQVALPGIKNKNWPRRSIDHFLLAEMEKRNLEPSAVAPARALIRRATFDLTGLPPTPEEVEAFENDTSPDAYARLIDRLLAAPQHGERWGRLWLDLARYCDVAEPWAENKGQAYLYRDWVVRAFNEDLPYDRFIHKQLAADLLPDHQPGDRAALGFLGLSPSYWKELKLAPDVIQAVVAEEWEERIQAVTSTFLGLTVACARCHDHKFDPVSAQDYYALAGIFASTRLVDRALVPEVDAQKVQEARAKVKTLQAEIAKLQAKKSPEPPIEDLKKQIEEVKKNIPHFDMPLVPAVDDASLFVLADGPHRTKLDYRPGVAQDVSLQVRGNPTNLGPVVPRRFLGLFSGSQAQPFQQGSGRLELAHAITKEAAPLTARVFVNRVWRHHFGRGLVETPSDFGSQGDRPSHPELLDDLAARFIANGWSIKWLHREMMLSAAYQQASAQDARRQAVDPENRWLSRMSRRRLEIEAWRDGMLAVTGTLKLDMGGPPLELNDLKNNRRTLYGLVKRRELNDMLRLHDFPDPTAHSPSRLPTTTPLQQLFTLNSPFVQQQSKALVQRLRSEVKGNDADRIRRAYWLLYGRPATARQVEFGLEFLQAQQTSDQAWNQYAQVLLGSNEFLFVD